MMRMMVLVMVRRKMLVVVLQMGREMVRMRWQSEMT